MEKRELICIGCPMGCPLTVTLDGGAVSLYGQPVTGASGRMGFMPQRDQLFPWRTIRDNVTLGLTVTKKRTPEALAYADAHCDHNGARDRRHPARRELQDPQRHPEGENF